MPVTYARLNPFINAHPHTFEPQSHAMFPLRDGPDAERMQQQLETETYLDFFNAIRWERSDNVPPRDILDYAHFLGIISDAQHAASLEARDADCERSLARYAAQQEAAAARGDWPDDETRFGALAAHGPGVVITDVFTGRTFVT